MFLPIVSMVLFVKDSPLFHNHDFQGVLGVSVAVASFLAFCNPLLLGFKWIFLKQLEHISKVCTDIKNGQYTHFILPNESNDSEDENEMMVLMRDMNWMIRQIEYREAELEKRVTKRTMELEKTNTALVKARDAAHASARAKSEFLTTMSHEIRTPMNAIIGMSDLAVKFNRDKGQKEYLNVINSASKSLLKIINDILDFSKMDAGKLLLENIPIHIRDLFEEIMDMFKSQMIDSKTELILDIDPKVPKSILGDPLRLRQVLTNLLSNAVKFTQQGEICIQIRLKTQTKEKQRLSFSVTDTGIGMDQETLEKLFTAFTQADGSTTRNFGGTGLGLAISKKIITLMGGEITVKSEKEKGSCFAFTLDFEACESANDLVPTLPTGFQGKEVLVAVKNNTSRKIILKFLEAFGVKATGYSSMQSAYNAAKEKDPVNPFSLAVLDTDLEDLDLSCRPDFFKDSSPKTTLPVIAMGSFNGKTNHKKPVWADKFLPKPVKQSMLFDSIMELFSTLDLHTLPDAGHKALFPRSKSLKILLVEDNTINQKVAREIFKTVGLVPVIAQSGHEAIDFIRKEKFDAVLMDIQMPGMNGYKATEKIREMEAGKDVPIIAMTANAMDSDRQKGFDSGMDDYITKPVDATILFNTLTACLKNNPPALETITPLITRIAAGRKTEPGTDPENIFPGNAFTDTSEEELPGIDMKEALERLNGNKALLEELIIEFAAENQNVFSDIRQLMLENKIQDLTAMVHRLKGTAGNISAIYLARSFLSLENKISDYKNKVDLTSLDLKSMVDDCETEFDLIFKTAQHLGNQHGKNTEEENEDPQKHLTSEIMGMVMELGSLIDQNSLKAKEFSKIVSTRLQATPFMAEARVLETQIKRFDFKSARKTFQDLEVKIKSQLPN